MVRLGPAVLVTAAFIGPGTVATCFVAGQRFGFALLWALVLATLATIVLQEMAARLGAGGRLGLGEALVQQTSNPILRWGAATLLVVALGLGNAAYEGGNLVGASLGAQALLGVGEAARPWVALGLAFIAGAALLQGQYKLLERLLIGLVGVMSAAFLLAMVLARPDLGALLKGLSPSVPAASLLTITALIGTTIVPYNLFLHAAAARERFASDDGVRAARWDTVIAVSLGGLVSCAVLIVSASTASQGSAAPNIMAALEPTLGRAGYFIGGIGLLAAGLTSAITAPMATGYVLSELVGGDDARRQQVFRLAAMTVLLAGALTSMLGIKPLVLILTAQAANGLLLPVVAIYLLAVMNNRSVLGEKANGTLPNLVGLLIVGVALLLGGISLGKVISVAG
ncbi:MAG: Nramp family divalent metal transporter [Parvularculaceae bacterium]|nr:Nramp family divalent metal transporter [Parvularculaceae bacterium]